MEPVTNVFIEDVFEHLFQHLVLRVEPVARNVAGVNIRGKVFELS